MDRSANSIAIAETTTEQATLSGSLVFHCLDAVEYNAESYFDVVCCIGASFAIGSLEELLAWADAWLKPGGVLAIGDIFARELPLPEPCVPHFAGGAVRDIRATIDLFENDGHKLLGVSESSMGEWDRYTSMHSFAADQWLRNNPDHGDAEAFVRWWDRFRRQHLFYDREPIGWALFVARKSG